MCVSVCSRILHFKPSFAAKNRAKAMTQGQSRKVDTSSGSAAVDDSTSNGVGVPSNLTSLNATVARTTVSLDVCLNGRKTNT